jgi:hypothetical protein
MAEKKTSLVSSPLFGALNNIVPIKRSARTLKNTQNSFQGFLKFMDVEIKNIELVKLPSKRKLREISNLNIASTFGKPANLLTSLASGALDVAGFVGDMFGRGKKQNPKAGQKIPNPKAGQKIPNQGPKIKLGGLKALGIANAIFAGLDFATGLQEGESVGKAAAGAGGALAGSLLGGAIGTALIPFPPLGFVVGSMAGNFLGGYLSDRGYEATIGAGNQTVKQKTRERLKKQEKEQKELAASASSTVTLPEVINKFEGVVAKFEKVAYNLQLQSPEEPTGYDEELSPEDSPELPEGSTPEGPENIQYGTGNAEFGETGNVSNSAGWVHGHFQGQTASEVVRDTTVVVKALLNQGSPVFLNPGVDLSPSKKYSDAEITKHVENARRSHTHSGTGKSIDVFVKKGTKVPVPLTNIGPTGSDYGGYGRGGLAGYIQGTRTWIGHLTPNSKSGISQPRGQIKTRGIEIGDLQNLKPNDDTKDINQAKPVSNIMGRQEVVEKATTNILTSTPEISQQNSATSPINVPMSMVMPSLIPSEQVGMPMIYEMYPEYNQPQSSVTLIPMIISSGTSQQRPVVVSSGGGGGGGGTVIMPPPPQGVLLNSLFKTMLLTNLSAM